jgi:outer membrane protein TolC
LGSFKQLLGVQRDTSVRVDGAISVEPRRFDAERLIESYVDGRLDIRALKASIRVQENFKDITFTGLFPSVTFRYVMDPTFQKDPFKDPWFSDIKNDWAQKAGGFYIILNIPLDGFIPGSQTQVELANQADGIRQTQINLAQARQGAALEIETIVMNLEKSIASIDTLKLNVQLAERAFRLAEEAYRAGNRELLEVQNAELELQKARNEVLKEQYNYTTGLLDLEYAINTEIDKVGRSR